jgi:S-adenosylmethionine decarboxylase
MSNDHIDSYVLSESSLFVYSHKIILKTCGTTTLLMCLEPLIEYTTALGMKIEWVAYTRKDFQRPGQQHFPHREPMEEVWMQSHCLQPKW